MPTVPPKIVYKGDANQCEAYRRFALVQLDILKRQMSFGNLKQLTRIIPTGNGSFITCKSIFGVDTIEILMPAVSPSQPAPMNLPPYCSDLLIAYNTEEMGGAWDVMRSGETKVKRFTMIPTDDDGSPGFEYGRTTGTNINVLKSYTYNLKLKLDPNAYNVESSIIVEKLPVETIAIFHNKSVNLADLFSAKLSDGSSNDGGATNQVENIKVYRTKSNITTLVADIEGNAVNFYVDEEGNFSIVRLGGWNEWTTDPIPRAMFYYKIEIFHYNTEGTLLEGKTSYLTDNYSWNIEDFSTGPTIAYDGSKIYVSITRDNFAFTNSDIIQDNTKLYDFNPITREVVSYPTKKYRYTGWSISGECEICPPPLELPDPPEPELAGVCSLCMHESYGSAHYGDIFKTTGGFTAASSVFYPSMKYTSYSEKCWNPDVEQPGEDGNYSWLTAESALGINTGEVGIYGNQIPTIPGAIGGHAVPLDAIDGGTIILFIPNLISYYDYVNNKWRFLDVVGAQQYNDCYNYHWDYGEDAVYPFVGSLGGSLRIIDQDGETKMDHKFTIHTYSEPDSDYYKYWWGLVEDDSFMIPTFAGYYHPVCIKNYLTQSGGNWKTEESTGQDPYQKGPWEDFPEASLQHSIGAYRQLADATKGEYNNVSFYTQTYESLPGGEPIFIAKKKTWFSDTLVDCTDIEDNERRWVTNGLTLKVTKQIMGVPDGSV